MFLVLLLSASVSFAAPPVSGARFLELGAGARELALGGASAAITDDVNALYWNPAGIANLDQVNAGLTHAEWLVDTRYDFVGLAAPSRFGSIGLSALYLAHGSQEGRDENRRRTGSFQASDLAVALSYASRVGPALSLGSTVKIIESRIAGDRARGVALDLGTQYQFRHPIAPRLGFSLRNIGADMKFVDQSDPLPLTMAMGLGQPLFRGVLLSTEWRYQIREEEHEFIMGAEYAVLPVLTLRGGYLAGLGASAFQDGFSSGEAGGMSGGLGFNLLGYHLDYAFSPFGRLGETHRFSLQTRFR